MPTSGRGGLSPIFLIFESRSDIGMPDTDGYEFLKQLKQIPGMNGVPAIAISGYASDEDRRRALGVGYCALIPKPIDADVLFELIHDLNLNLIK